MVGGTGDEGYGLALRWAKHGYEVIIGSRALDRATSAADNIRKSVGGNTHVSGMVNNEAVAKADIVVIAVPFAAVSETIKALKPSFREGQLVINLTVPLETAIGGRPTRTINIWDGSAGELCARVLPKNVKLVSAFNNVSAHQLNELSKPLDCDVLVCGDDDEAKKTVSELVKAIPGLRYLDTGRLENSRTIEQITSLLVSLNIKYGINNAGVKITGITTR